jgi:hypothetical protein
MPERPPSYRVEPDVEFADRLERILVQQLAAPASAEPAEPMRVTATSRIDTTTGNGWTHDNAALIELHPITAAGPPAPHRLAAKIALGTAAAALFALALTAVIRTEDERDPADVPPPTLDAPPPTLDAAPATTTLTTSPAPTPSVVAPGGVENPIAEPTWSGDMWPQSGLEEVGEAQARADAGDPNATWQLAPDIAEDLLSGTLVEVPEVFSRFLREALGWADFAMRPGPGFGSSDFGTETIFITFVRCSPGATDPAYPDEPRVGGCVPTMNQGRYETVEVTVTQPGLQGPSGIWVVTSLEVVAPIERVVPLADAESTAILEAFLQARLDGAGAEQHLGGGDGRARLMYATTAGAPYERFEFARQGSPNWPNGSMQFEVRLFAEDGQTEVLQSFGLKRDVVGSWTLEPGSEMFENGNALPPLFDILGGEVTFSADHTWEGNLFGANFEVDGEPAEAKLFHTDGTMRILADPLPIVDDCQEGAPAADAAALARSIVDDPRFDATAPSATTVGGAAALQIDLVTSAGADVCAEQMRFAIDRGALDAGRRMRLYLVDLPGGSARILSIAIVAPEDQFERVVEAAVPVVNSIEFHAG